MSRPCLASLSFVSPLALLFLCHTLLSFSLLHFFTSSLLPTPTTPQPCQLPHHLSYRGIMGTLVDSEKAYSPSRRPTMIRRERREAKRRMVLLSLLACFLFLTLIAFRQSNSFMSDYTHQAANSTSSAPAKTNPESKSWLTGRPKSVGPILSNNGRHLSDSSLADLKNTSLGVRDI